MYNYLANKYDDRWFGWNGPHIWPPRSPDLTPIDLITWGNVKSPFTTKENCQQILLHNRKIDLATSH